MPERRVVVIDLSDTEPSGAVRDLDVAVHPFVNGIHRAGEHSSPGVGISLPASGTRACVAWRASMPGVENATAPFGELGVLRASSERWSARVFAGGSLAASRTPSR